MKPSRPLALEQLEDRCVPATFGNPWPNAQHLTLSFPLDGTPIGPAQNQLAQNLSSAFSSPAAWQREILRALQTWAVNANVNISVMPDGGQAFGAAGVVQGDERFGDVRVGAYALDSDVLALEEPFDVTAGTWAGDLVFNSKQSLGFQPSTGYDLFSVALHEAGHVFGLDHSKDPSSPMYESYLGVRTGLIAEDIARLQAFYGVRQPDRFEGSRGNDSFDNAVPLTLLQGVYLVPGVADVTTQNDKDFYKVSLPALSLSGYTVKLQTHDVSLLNARVTVYDANRRVVAQAVATDPANGDLAIRLPGSLLATTYYIKVESATTDVFGIGGYRLLVSPSGLLNPETVFNLLSSATNLLNNTLASALGLTQVVVQTDERFDYAYNSTIGSSSESDWYLLRSPTPPAGQPNVMTVMAWGKKVNGLDPRTSIYDALGNPVAASVLVNENGTYVLQVPNAPGNALYYVKLNAATSSGPSSQGDYFLGIDFSTVATQLNGLVNSPAPTTVASNLLLTSQHDQLFHFVLSVAGSSSATGVQLAVYDQLGRQVSIVTVNSGETRSLTLFLGKGGYTFRVTRTGTAATAPAFTLSGIDLSDPEKPYSYDSTADPAGSSSSSSSTTTTSSSSTSWDGSYSYATW